MRSSCETDRGRAGAAARFSRGYTLIELIAVLVIIALAIIVFLPMQGGARITSRQMTNSTQVRGIHQGHVLFSQGNNGYYAGLDGVGEPVPALTASTTQYGAAVGSVSMGVALLFNGNYFTPTYVVNPMETNAAIKPLAGPGVVTPMNYSYAALKVDTMAKDWGRVHEWYDQTNTEAPILGDRVLDSGGAEPTSPTVPASKQRSVFTTTDGDWRRSVVFGDNSTSFLTTSSVSKTKFEKTINTTDNLFLTTGPTDAFFVRN